MEVGEEEVQDLTVQSYKRCTLRKGQVIKRSAYHSLISTRTQHRCYRFIWPPDDLPDRVWFPNDTHTGPEPVP